MRGLASPAIQVGQGIERRRLSDRLTALVLDADDDLGMRIDDQAHRLSGQIKGHLETRAQIDALAPADAVPEKLAYVTAALSLLRRELAGEKMLLGFGGSPWTLATYMVEGGSSDEFERIKLLFHTDRATFDALLEKLKSNC